MFYSHIGKHTANESTCMQIYEGDICTGKAQKAVYLHFCRNFYPHTMLLLSIPIKQYFVVFKFC